MKKTVLFSLTIAIMFSSYMVITHHFPVASIPLHFMVVITLYALLYVLNNLFLKLNFWPNFRSYVGVFLLELLLLVLCFIYLLNLVSNTFWGGNVNTEFYLMLNKHVDWLLTTYNVNATLVGFVFTILLVLLYYLLFKITKPFWINQNQQKSSTLILMVFLIGILITAVYFERNNKASLIWKYDPVLSALRSGESQYNTKNAHKHSIIDSIYRKNFLQTISKGTKPDFNVIFIMADSLRADKVYEDSERNLLPFLRSIKDSKYSQSLKNFYSECSESSCGILNFLTSRMYKNIGFGLYDVTDVLKDLGYDKYFYLSGDHEWKQLRKLYGNNHDIYFSGKDLSEEYSIGDDLGVIKQFEKDAKGFNEPFVSYIHLMSGHFSGIQHEEFEVFKPAKHYAYQSAKTKNSNSIKNEIVNAHDNGLIQLDAYVKDIFNVLKEHNYLKNSIVIILSDHGEPLGEKGSFYHTNGVSQIDIRIPLVMYSENSICKLNEDSVAMIIDVAPTVLDCLGVAIPDSWDGLSLAQDEIINRITFHQTIREKQEVAVIRHQEDSVTKMIATLIHDELSDIQVYDIIGDPEELNNIAKTIPEDEFIAMKKLLIDEFIHKID